MFVQVSVACQVRIAVNRFGQRGLAALVTVLTRVITTFVPEQTSTAVGAVKPNGLPHSMIWFGAQLSAGGVVSTIVMLWLQVAMLVQVSVACHVRVTLNKFGQRGLAALVTVLTTVIVTLVPSQISTAVGAVKLNGLPHSIIWLGVQLNRGGVESTIVIV